MSRNRFRKDIGKNFQMVTCDQCGQQITKRSSKALETLEDGSVTGKTENGKQITTKSKAKTRICKPNLNTYPEECKRFNAKRK